MLRYSIFVFAALFVGRISGQNVKITLSGNANAPPINFVEWELTPGKAFELFCIGDPGLSQLAFKCKDCNGTERMFKGQRDQSVWFDERSAPITLGNGAEGIKLTFEPSNDMNGRTLQCLGRQRSMAGGNANGQAAGGQLAFPPAGGNPVGVPLGAQATADVQLRLRYRGKPYIVRSDGSPPMRDPVKGNVFYVQCQRQELSKDTEGNPVYGPCQFTGQLDLRCETNANPMPSYISWTSGGGVELVKSQILSLSASDIYQGLSVQCHTRMGGQNDPSESFSAAVLVLQYEMPTLYSNNYDKAIPENGIMTLNEAGSPKTVDLQCNVIAYPAPAVFWLHNAGGTARGHNVACQSRKDDTRKMIDGRIGVSSHCTIALTNYTSAGDYWCVPCVQTAGSPYYVDRQQSTAAAMSNMLGALTQIGGIGNNAPTNFQCATGLDLSGRVPNLPHWVAKIQVTGPPMMFDERPFSVLQQSGATKAVIEARYCAIPEPGRGDVKWYVNGREVVAGGPRIGNYLALQPKPNGTTPGCYVAPLQIEPVTQSDLDSRFEFYTRNVISARRQSFNLEALLNPSSEPVDDTAVYTAWLIVLIVLLVLAFLFCLCCVFFCFVKRICCFSPGVSKRPSEQAPSSAYAVGSGSSKDNKYLSNIAPEHLSSEPAPGGGRSAQPLHYGNGYSSHPRGVAAEPEVRPATASSNAGSFVSKEVSV